MGEWQCGATAGRDTLAFFADISAGQLHDLTNVVSIIDQLAGLQEDLLNLQEAGQPAVIAKQRLVIEKIQQNVERSKGIIRTLHEFTRGPRDADAVFDVKKKTSELVELAQRWARLAKVELVANLAADEVDEVMVENDSMLYQQALFRCIEMALASATGTRKLMVGCRRVDGGAEIEVSSADPIRTEGDQVRVSVISQLVKALGGEMRVLPDNGGMKRLAFVISGARSSGAGSDGAQELL